jgi:SAM-dependent methyltransferase
VWPHRLGLVILAGARATFEPIDVEADTSLFLTAGAALSEISSDGLELVVRFTPVHEDGSTGAEQTVLTRHIEGFDAETPWVEIMLPLGSLVYGRGVVALECGPGPLGEPSADWLAIYEMVVGPAAQQSLHRARGHNERRYTADLARFEQRHDASVLDKNSDYAGSPLVAAGRPAFGLAAGPVTTLERQLARAVSVVELGNRALARGLQRNPPDFQQRLGARLAGLRTGSSDVTRKLRVLSLCSGVGRVERALLQGIWPEAVALTLWDRNADVAEVTASRLAAVCEEVTVVEDDVNHLDLQGERYDVILCASGLHHLVELEHVLSTVSDGLEADGEFWSIAEFVGRNGYRMWPGARAVANAFFADLPEAYRVSRVGGGAAELDEKLGDLDQSVQTLEGIRSQEIEGLLQQNFAVQDSQARSCFLWSLLEPAYVSNYDLHAQESIELIERAAALDVKYQLAGGRPGILNGVYRKSH